jgi:alpha-N-acetylglucosaminidase
MTATTRMVICGVLAWLGACTAARASPSALPAFDTAPARSALKRLVPHQQAQFTLIALVRHGTARFRVSGSRGHIVVAGTSPAVLLTGVETYLEKVAGVSIEWPGDSVSRLPTELPGPAVPIEGRAIVANRYALNDVDDGYSDAYLGWEAWEHKIDLLALHGINEVFMPIGTEEVYRRTFGAFGYSDRAVRAWIPAAAHQPWWLLQNMSAFDGPISPHQLARRVALARKIVARLRALGMTPVFPGYFGTVPPAFAARNPNARVIRQGRWNGFERPDWLDPRDPLYERVAATFYRNQLELFGATTLYKMDLLHEGGRSGGVPVAAAARRVMAALHAAHPGARWLMLGWQRNPLPAVIEAVPHGELLIVDGLSDRYEGLDREKTWQGTPYAFGTIPNFGGHTTLGANTGVWRARFSRWRDKPGSTTAGIAWMPEASGRDPAAFALFTSLAWREQPTGSRHWFAGYATSRYGGADPHATAAWRILGQTAYAMAAGNWSEAQDSLFDARPSLHAQTAASWSPPRMRYDGRRFNQALCQLLEVAPALRNTSAYRYDVVDIARQALSNQARVLLPQVRSAYEERDAPRLRALADQWMSDMALLDRLLATEPHFLLGRWQAPARAAAGNASEAARLEYDQRSIISTWGGREAADGGALHDYANRELSGLVSGLYAPRWRRYFLSLEQGLAAEATPKPIDWFAMEDAWAHAHASEPTAPRGDPWRIANRVADRLGVCAPGLDARQPTLRSGGTCLGPERAPLGRRWRVSAPARSSAEGHARRAPSMMIIMPVAATAAPTISHTVGRIPSTSHSHRMAMPMYTPPYAAYTRPAAVGCKVKSPANTARLSSAGISSHGEPSLLSQR